MMKPGLPTQSAQLTRPRYKNDNDYTEWPRPLTQRGVRLFRWVDRTKNQKIEHI